MSKVNKSSKDNLNNMNPSSKNNIKIKNPEKNEEEEEEEDDNEVIRPKIIRNWPEVKEDNNNISRKIKKALGLWAEQKEKYHTYKENDTIQFNLPGFNIGMGNKEKEHENENENENNQETNEPENEKVNINSIRRNYQNEKDNKKKIELKDMITDE